MESSAGHVGAAIEVVRPDSGHSCPSKPSKGDLKKVVRNHTQFNSLCSTAKSKSKAPSPPCVKHRILRPQNTSRLSGQIPPTPVIRTRTVDKDEGMAPLGEFPTSLGPISMLDRSLHHGCGILGPES